MKVLIGDMSAVKPVFQDCPTDPQKVVLYNRWSFIRGTNI